LFLAAIGSAEVFLVWLILRTFRRPIARLSYFLFRRSIVIEPNRDRSLAFRFETAPASSAITRMLRFMTFGTLYSQFQLQLAQPSFKTYSMSGLQFPSNIMWKLMAPLWADRVCLLFINPAIALYPWEAIIGSWEIRGWRQVLRFLRRFAEFVRPGDVLPRVPRGLAEWSSASIRVLSRPGLATAAWKSTTGVDVRVVETLRASSDSALRVLHLIGRARRGTSGSVFSVGGQGSHLGEMVSIDELPLSDTAIVIVQEEPAERLRRLDVDREQAADARDWAAQVFRAGAHTVIFIPAMPFALAEQSVPTFGF